MPRKCAIGTVKTTTASGRSRPTSVSRCRRQRGVTHRQIASAKPELDHTRYHSVEELRQHGLQHLRDAVSLLEQKATPDEVDAYKRFVVTLADKVANAHREGGVAVSDAERAAIAEITAALGPSGG